MENMDKETQEELNRLEREIWREDKDLSDILADDVLKDLDALLAEDQEEEAAPQAMEKLMPEKDEPDGFRDMETLSQKTDPDDSTEEEDEEEEEEAYRKDSLLIGLLITACALCAGIIGVMIYWLENFL